MKKMILLIVFTGLFSFAYAEEKNTDDYSFVKHWKETGKTQNQYNYNIYYGDLPNQKGQRPPYIVPYPIYGPYPEHYQHDTDDDGNQYNITIFDDGKDENYIYHKDPSKDKNSNPQYDD